MLSAFNFLIGAGMLVLGRKLFWLFVAAGGFIAGVQFAERFIHGPDWLTLAIGIIVGIALAVLAIFLRVIAIAVAGFFLGGAILTSLAQTAGFDQGMLVVYILGGVLGAILVSYLFNWAVITLTSVAGATLILRSLNLNSALSTPLLLILVIVGVVIQGIIMRREKKPDAA